MSREADLSKGNGLLLLHEYRVFIRNKYQREVKEKRRAEVLKRIIALVPLFLRVCEGDVQEEPGLLWCLWHW